MSEYRLTQEIIALSESSTWEGAKREWALEDVYEEDEPDTCLCGHTPIIEICTLRNRLNGNLAVVGNVCVKKFLGLPSDPIFRGVKRIQKDVEKALNEETIHHAHARGWINEWERDFCLDTRNKRRLSPKQLEKRVQINSLVIQRIVNARRQGG